MSTKHQPCGQPGCINCWAPATGFDGQAAPYNQWHTEHLHPLQQTLRDNGDLIAAQATIAQQAQMIERLRNQVQSMIDQTTPLIPVPGDPMWSRRITIDELQAELNAIRGGLTPGFTGVDMANAAADGFRDGVAKLNAAYLAGWSASGQGWNGEHPCGACERETWAKDRDADIQKIIAADVSKEG